MLDLIEHLASGVKDVPAPDPVPGPYRPARRAPEVGRGQRACHRDRAGGSAAGRQRAARRRARRERIGRALARSNAAVLGTTEGNPLFIEETVRMLLESGGEPDRDPAHRAGDDLRPDRPAAARPSGRCSAGRRGRPHVLVGRDRGTRRHPARPRRLQELVERDFLVREPRSTIRGEEAYRFKHVLIRDVAYAGLSKSSRALLHRQMAAVARRRAAGGRARRDPGLPPRRGRGAG